MKDAVEAGEFDAELSNPNDAAGATVNVKVPTSRRRCDPNAAKKAGWSDEGERSSRRLLQRGMLLKRSRLRHVLRSHRDGPPST